MMMQRALSGLCCRKIPHWELEFQLWDAFSGKRLILGREFEALSPKERERALYSNAEQISAVATALQFDAVSAPNSYWEHAPGQLAYYVLPPDGSPHLQVSALRRTLPPEIMVVANSGAILGIPGSGSYLEFSCKLFDAPEEIDVQAANVSRFAIENMKRLRECGADIFLTASDIADNHGLYFNPEQMDRFILPYLDLWARECHAQSAFSIMHSDGKLDAVLPQLAATHLDALQAIDPVAGMNIVEAKAIVGNRLCLCGNIDCGMILRGTPEQVYKETTGLLEQCAGMEGFVLGMSNASQPESKVENYRAMVQAGKDFYARSEARGTV